MRLLGTPVVKAARGAAADALDPAQVTGLYGAACTATTRASGTSTWSGSRWATFTVYAGWLRAIRTGHAELHRGLDLPGAVLVLSSGASSLPTEMGEEVHGTDIVLEVEQIRRWSTALGRHVTYVAVDGARHDVVLSRPAGARAAYAEIERWLDGVRRPAAQPSRNDTRAATPTTTMTTRSTAAGSRRPTVAPIWPPTTDPTAIRATTSQSTSATAMNSRPATALTIAASTFLMALWPLQAVVDPDPEDRHQQTPWAAPK